MNNFGMVFDVHVKVEPLLTLAHAQKSYCNRSVCVPVPTFSVAAMETKRGYVGKYHRCSRLTEIGALFPGVRHIPSGKCFLGVLIRDHNS